MFRFEIDSAQVEAALEAVQTVPDELMPLLLEQAGVWAYGQIQEQANALLDSTRARFLEDVSPPALEGDSVVINFGDFASQIESGYPSFDMKPGLLKGRPYAVIRFRQKWPEADWGSGRGFGTPISRHQLERTSKEEATRLGRSLLRHLKALEEDFSRSRSRRVTRATKGVTSKKFEDMPHLVSKRGRVSVSPAFEGIRREQIRKNRVGPGGSRIEYAIYRTVSENSDPESWIHPGYEGLHVLPDLQRELQSQVDQMARGILTNVGTLS